MSSVYDTNTLTASEICELAGEDPDEVLTKWVVEDIAAALIESCAEEFESEEAFKVWAVNVLKTCDKSRITDILVGGSHWDESIPEFIHWDHCSRCGMPDDQRESQCICKKEED